LFPVPAHQSSAEKNLESIYVSV